MPNRSPFPLLLLGLFSLLPAPSIAQKPETTGVYKDRDGKEHPWVITPTHALLWNRQAYVPIGGVFAPRYLGDKPTEENWALDVKALATLKAKGMQDIVLDTVASPLDLNASQLQRVLDHLESNGFRYGFTFGAGAKTPLAGTIVKPANYRITGIEEGGEANWESQEADRAYFLFVDSRDPTQVQQEGTVRVERTLFSVGTTNRVNRESVGLLYPHKTMKPGRDGSLPDIWSAYDMYRDRLLVLLNEVKFGAGLRFFLDPLAHPMTLGGDTEYLIPDSPAFRLEFEGYLARRYATIEDLMVGWALLDREIKDFKEAANLVPLWERSKGAPFLYDATSKKRLRINGPESKFWGDFRECRNDSIIYYMNVMADTLKREVANVPVVYTRTVHHRMFTNPARKGGFDGLGIAAYARGSALVTSGADSVYGQCEESGKSLWLLVTETLDTNSPTKAQIGYPSKQAMFYDLDWLRGIGAKGFFVKGFQVLPEGENKKFQLLDAPEQVDWLKEYSEKLKKELDIANTRPRFLPFPASAGGIVQAGPIGNGGVWWIPNLAPGRPIDFGSSYAGYTITLPDGEITVLWSLRGARETTLFAPFSAEKIEAFTPDGATVPLKVDKKKRTVTLLMDETPRIFKTGDQELLPLEVVSDTLNQLKLLVLQGISMKMDVQNYQNDYITAERQVKERQYSFAYGNAKNALRGIVGLVQPYVWLEGELATTHTFSEATLNDAASGKMFLSLNTSNKPPREGYQAQFKFGVPAKDTYNVWVACSQPGALTSPFEWAVDGAAPQSSLNARADGRAYLADKFVWVNLGRVALDRGDHQFILRVTDRVAGLDKYMFALDSVLITRNGFTPNGVIKPPLIPGLDAIPDTPKRP